MTIDERYFGYENTSKDIVIGTGQGGINLSRVTTEFEDRAISVKWYGAKGDGETDDTSAIQEAIDALTDGQILYFPSGNYKRGYLTIKDKSNIRIMGRGATHTLIGSDAKFELQGTIDGLVIEGLTIQGNGVVSDRHSLTTQPSGQTLKNIIIRDNIIHNVVLGISVNADTSGTIDNVLIENNTITTIVGEGTGEGYGIHVSHHDSSVSANIVIRNNTIYDAYRHSIYVARGRGFKVLNNNIIDHKKNASNQTSPRSAINISRSADVQCYGNLLDNTHTAGIMVGSDESGSSNEATNIHIKDNVIRMSNLEQFGISVGYVSPSTKEPLTYVEVEGNIVHGAISLYFGKKVSVRQNIVRRNGKAIFLNAEEDDGGTNNYSDDWVIEHNTLSSGDDKTYRLNGYATSLVTCLINGNDIHYTTSPFSSAYLLNHDKLTINGHGSDGISLDSGGHINAPILGKGTSGTFSTSDGTTIEVENGVVKSIV